MTPSTDERRRAEWLGWIAWAIAALFYGYGFFQRVAPGVLVSDLMRDLALDGTRIGTLSAAYFYAYAAVQIPTGLLLDRFGARRLLACASLLAAAGGFVFAAAGGLGSAIVGRAAIGAGVGVAYVGCLAIAATSLPPERFGLVAGLTLTVGTAGALSAQIPLAVLVDLLDWRATMAGVAALGVLMALAAFFGIRDAGFDRQGNRARASMTASLAAILGRSETWWLAGVTAFLGAPVLTFAGLWGVPYFRQVAGLAREQAGLFTSLLLVAWAVGGPLMGAVSDRVGRRPVLIACALLMAASWLPFLLAAPPPMPLATAAMLVMGVAGGAMVVAYAAARDRFAEEGAATAMGIVNSSVLLAGALLQTFVGWFLDLGWRGQLAEGARVYPAAAWRGAWVLLFCSPIAAAVCAWLLPRRAECGMALRTVAAVPGGSRDPDGNARPGPASPCQRGR
ncbi:putative sulfoacetate transporter SauU [bacterium HR40]|nr:putative sulfoacetate transporter SauU [bacterium HR40]